MVQCPTCGSPDIHRSRPKSKWESWRRHLTHKRPYRCGACGRRAWSIDVGPNAVNLAAGIAIATLAPEPLTLDDTALPREEPSAALDLGRLDAIDSQHDKKKSRPGPFGPGK